MSYEDYILKARRAQAAAAAVQSNNFTEYRRQYEILRNQPMGAGRGSPGPSITGPGWQTETHYERIMKAQMLQREIMLRESERLRELENAASYTVNQAQLLREKLIVDLLERQ